MLTANYARGVSKERANLDGWIKEVDPSAKLRKWFGHKAEKFDEFGKCYWEELDETPEAQEEIRKIIKQNKQGTVTLLYAARDPQINHAILLKLYIENKTK